MITIEIALSKIKEDIVTRNRGGEKGMHGFIAEIAECGIGNARQQIEGEAATHVWVNDNGPVDIMRGAQAIQQKFVQSGGHLSLQAVRMHMYAKIRKKEVMYYESPMQSWRLSISFFQSGNVSLTRCDCILAFR